MTPSEQLEDFGDSVYGDEAVDRLMLGFYDLVTQLFQPLYRNLMKWWLGVGHQGPPFKLVI